MILAAKGFEVTEMTRFLSITDVSLSVQFIVVLPFLGNSTNLFDVVVGNEVAVLQGCGLGGGSLINANVGLDCDPRVLEDEVSVSTDAWV